MSTMAKVAATSAITGAFPALGALAMAVEGTKQLGKIALNATTPERGLANLVIPGGDKEFLKAAFDAQKG